MAHPPTSFSVPITSSRHDYFIPSSTPHASAPPDSPGSSSSSASSLSPGSSALASSSMLVDKHHTDGSEGSAATSASPGSEAGDRKGSVQMDISALTVRDEDSKTTMKRASEVPNGRTSSDPVLSPETERDSVRPTKRKVVRTGSFQRGGEERESQEAEKESVPLREAGSKSSPESSKSRPPIAINTSRPSTSMDSLPTKSANPSPPTQPHVDIVNYPSADLLRLLALLLEQIARANDELNQRAAPSTSGSETPARRHSKEDSEDSHFSRGTFDAAPLNSPVTPRYRRSMRQPSRDDSGSDGDNEDEEEMEVDVEAEEDNLPVTPGVDLLNEVDAMRPGVAGFMPSLGGSHTPQPLPRRRGASFLKKHDSFASTNTTPGGSNLPVPEPPLTSLLTASSLALSSPSATLCFHARNIPAISIESYLLRILKYCPTTNEVFLSLLVYFDRMARVGLEAQRVGLVPPVKGEAGATPARLFAIDSYNIHRLVIAGVTVASKFFSDVFYTNSRYAKVRRQTFGLQRIPADEYSNFPQVGGLPLNELNQLELQFLLLNDFRLVIPLDELQRYADQLILFWVGRNPPATQGGITPPAPSTPALTASAVANASAGDANTDIPSRNQDMTRPRSIRSQPSSSGTSVTSTITPGTPSTPRASDDGRATDSSGEEESDEEQEERGEVAIPINDE
ncbi:PHO85 cyclin-6/7, partial [Phenoliferia sp. Uapishka_3]